MSAAFEYLLRTHVEENNDAPICQNGPSQKQCNYLHETVVFEIHVRSVVQEVSAVFLELKICYPVTKVHPSTMP